MTIHPIITTQCLRTAYLDYLQTIKPFQDEALRAEFATEIAREDALVKGPMVQIALPYLKDLSIKDLVDEGILSPRFQDLCSEHLPYERPLYTHQVRAIRKLVAGRNLVVSTGTGSGKTETFLLPIINALLLEEEQGTLKQPGVRALLLYPMNALANDQMKRLRRVLNTYPSITFGRYTGETPKLMRNAREDFHRVYPKEPNVENELMSREEMHENPPHILLTNYAMLEYLLLRPLASPLFEGVTGKHWRFIVLDEAHVYDGANATEMGMLLRRVQERVAGDQHGKIQGIATSATIGRGKGDFPAVADFATKLFNKPFVWGDSDEEQDVVGAEMMPISQLGAIWGSGTPEMYHELLTELRRSESIACDLSKLSEIARAAGVPDIVIKAANQAAKKNPELAINMWLYELLRGDHNIHHLLEVLKPQPDLLHLVAKKIFPDALSPEETLVELIEVAVMAKTGEEDMPLLPARYHTFARALEGAFVCLNTDGHPKGEPRLFLHRQKTCPTCHSRVFELANCTRCGIEYLVGQEVEGKSLRSDPTDDFQLKMDCKYLIQDSNLTQSEQKTSYYTFAKQSSPDDEDELSIEDDKGDDGATGTLLTSVWLCPYCGQIQDLPTPKQCACKEKLIPIQKVDLGHKKTLRKCIKCSVGSSSGNVFRFLTGQDAPVSVLASELYKQIPPIPDMDMPGNGRKLLNFTDSRQNAAFFAPYMERAHMRTVRRALIMKSLSRMERLVSTGLTMSDLIDPLIKDAEEIGLFEEKDTPQKKRRKMAIWLMQDFAPIDRRISLEGLGLIHFEALVRPGWQVPDFLSEGPWNFTKEEAYSFFSIMLNTLRLQGVVTYLLSDQLSIETAEEFKPRNRASYVRKLDREVNKGVFAWMPATSRSNSRLAYLVRLLTSERYGKSECEAKQVALLTLDKTWLYLTDTNSPWSAMLSYTEIPKKGGGAYQVAVDMWKVKPSNGSLESWVICDRCNNIYRYHIGDTCLTYGCDGHLEPLQDHEEFIRSNLYRKSYESDTIIPLTAQEHTAQWTSEAGARIQDQFVKGEINVLSCSTTFELGVDVGDLQVVLMRNMPPRTANYVQRAGRAGRRTDSAAYVLTFAQRRSHDLTYFDDPVKMVAGEMKPPYVSLTNEKVLRRHLHSVVFADFFMWSQQKFTNVGDFFAPTEGQDGRTLLREFLSDKPEALKIALEQILPKEMHPILGIAEWSWVKELISDSDDGVLDLAFRDVLNDLNYVHDELERERIKTPLNPRAITFLQSLEQNLRSKELYGFLGSRNVLPKYGFPTDVVELRTSHLAAIEEAQQIELSRDLRVAISEFAPGSQVVAAKKVWTSIGLKVDPGKAWEPIEYAICDKCGKFYQGNPIPLICSTCTKKLIIKKYIIPRFGFVASREISSSGDEPPKRTYASKTYFADYAEDKISSFNEPIEYVLDDNFALPTRIRYSRFGWMALVNDGFGQGFRICYRCGRAEVISFLPGNNRGIGLNGHPASIHEHPITGQKCNGTMYPVHLGQRYLTDVLEIQVIDERFHKPALLSMLYALLDGASEALSIRREDIDGTIFPRALGDPPSIILFDTVPGGAGHVEHIRDHLTESIKLGWIKVRDCQCGEDTSCYSCLRNYSNQGIHDLLVRSDAERLLRIWLGENG